MIYKIHYIYKNKSFIDSCVCDTEQEALDGFDMAHAGDKLLLVNIELERR